ncbi:pH-response regulator protein palI/RIM9 [Cladobotryum mycophilum]|uniref:PH-response regulator protein palI/RIM9 n=1 Tax=Cladobotryum mycophilum TaxID=491253 RepID=A0ABR0T2P4_9HYPO
MAHELAARIPPAVSPVNNGNYYEDVDPRFDQANNNHSNHTYRQQSPPVEADYEVMRDAASGARSPAESERSNFTSISQRGINPEWNPHPPMPQPPYGSPARRPVQQRRDMLLDNPDFMVPGGRSGPGQRGPGGMIPGSAYPTGPL